MCDLGWGCGCHSYAQRLWTSQSVLVDGGRDGPELCGIINAALRDDDPALAPPLAAVARAINQAHPLPPHTHAPAPVHRPSPSLMDSALRRALSCPL